MTKIMADLRHIARAVRSVVVGDAIGRKYSLKHDDQIIRRLDLLMQGHTELVKAITVQLERIRPSRLAWIQAGFFFSVLPF